MCIIISTSSIRPKPTLKSVKINIKKRGKVSRLLMKRIIEVWCNLQQNFLTG